MRRALAPATAVAALLVPGAACSDDGGGAAPPTSTTVPGASTSAPSPAPTTVPATSTPPPTTAGGGTSGGASTGRANGNRVEISGFGYVGPSPVECNAPTSIELRWTASGADRVEMRIDGGPVFARYGNGTRQELLPLPCDGRAHTYELAATAPGVDVRRSVTVRTRAG